MKPGIAPAGHSTPSSPGRPGTGLTQSPARQRRGSRCGQAAGFSEPEHWLFDGERSYTRDQRLDQLPTQAGHSQFPSDKLQKLLDGVGAAIDAVAGSFTMHYAGLVVTAVRLHGA